MLPKALIQDGRNPRIKLAAIGLHLYWQVSIVLNGNLPCRLVFYRVGTVVYHCKMTYTCKA